MHGRVALAATFVALALAGTACTRARSGDQIATNIKARMFSDPQLKGTALRVTVKDGIATISGQVPSVAARYEAFKVATETAGVKKVADDMTVAMPSMANQTTAAGAPAPRLATLPKPRRRRHVAARHAQPAPPPSAAAESGPAASENAAESGTGKTESATAENAPAQPENTPTTTPSAPAAPVPPPTESITVPAGTKVSVQMIDSIDSSVNHTGDIFHAELADPLVIDKKVVAPKGANVYLRLVEARSAGHISGQSELRVELYRLELRGKSYELVSNDYIVKGKKRGKRSALAIIGGAAIGAAIGAITGGGKGAAIGAAAGGGGGAVYQEATKGKHVTIPSESLVHFTLQDPVDVTFPASTPTKPGQPASGQNPGH